MQVLVKRLLTDSSGATAIEYGLIAALIAVGILVGLNAFGDGLQVWYENIRDGLEGT
ncbi:MAG: Flp family type IVb pilin [Phenylobacterium sp.]|jgi:pilus assembly protein Flp/PilA|uniref:Flp family type IVb pilin n=2 Tax=Phenylobacterium sp. TaxID=1871053 RepID=UPI00355DFAD4